MNKHKILLAITGASGAIYAKRFLERMQSIENVDLAWVASENALEIWKTELPQARIVDYDYPQVKNNDFYTPYASGSSAADCMIIMPASMGIVGRIANGVSDDLITRAADVCLKERKRLIVVPREAPYNLIHLRNMTQLTEAGAIVCPASPSFYSGAATLDELADTVVERVMKLAGIDGDFFAWGQKL